MSIDDDNDIQAQDCCSRVRTSCKAWMTEPRHQALVQIQPSKVRELATCILRESSDGTRPPIEWDEEQWHYRPSSKISSDVAKERLAMYILAMDAINFCFWPSHVNANDTGTSTNFEYEHLVKAMALMAKQDEEQQAQTQNYKTLNPDYVFSPTYLANLTPTKMKELWNTHLTILSKELSVPPITPLDNIETRCKLWNEIGCVLLKDPWNGSILNFLAQPSQPAPNRTLSSDDLLTAPQLVDRIVASFAGFRDCCAWDSGSNANNNNNNSTTFSARDKRLHLYKRAQICVGDLNAALELQLQHTSQITTFADYRVPQLLRHLEILEYDPQLASTLDEGQEIQQNSLEEKTIRAATVIAVEDLVKELKQQQQKNIIPTDLNQQEDYTAMKVDWYLWQMGEQMHMKGLLKPHHKTRTTFY